MFNRVVLVDEKNNEIGTEDKLEAHKKGLLHRAFSIFIFNDKNEILLQKELNQSIILLVCGQILVVVIPTVINQLTIMPLLDWLRKWVLRQI